MTGIFTRGSGWRITAFVFTHVLLCSSGVLDAMNWPAENAVLVRSFGSNDNGRPALGMVFSGNAGAADVLAAEKGEVIFSRRENDSASRLPSPLGAWTAIDHGDGLISIYSRYAAERAHAERALPEQDSGKSDSFARVEKQQAIASCGTSGWSSRNGLYFMIYDRRERRWINPEMIITPLRQTPAPQILSVEFRNAQGAPVQPRNFNQGRYTVVVNAGAPAQTRGTLLAPQKIVCLVNGAEAGALNFEAVSARDGVLMVYRNGLVPAKQIYANYPAFEAAEVFLNRGQVTLEIIVQDISGNSRNNVTRITVN